MASGKADTKNQVVLAPRNSVLLGLLLLQLLFALTVFGGALDMVIKASRILQKRDLLELDAHRLYPRRGRRGGGSDSDGSSIELSWEVVVYYALSISVVFLLYNLAMIYKYFRNKMNLGSAIRWSVSFWIMFLASAIITVVWTQQYESFSLMNSPSLAAITLGAILLVVALTVSIPHAWKVRKDVLKQLQLAPAPIATSQNPGNAPSQGAYIPMVATPGPAGQFQYQQPGQAPPGQQWVLAPVQTPYSQQQPQQCPTQVYTSYNPPTASMSYAQSAPATYPPPQFVAQNDYSYNKNSYA